MRLLTIELFHTSTSVNSSNHKLTNQSLHISTHSPTSYFTDQFTRQYNLLPSISLTNQSISQSLHQSVKPTIHQSTHLNDIKDYFIRLFSDLDLGTTYVDKLYNTGKHNVYHMKTDLFPMYFPS